MRFIRGEKPRFGIYQHLIRGEKFSVYEIIMIEIYIEYISLFKIFYNDDLEKNEDCVEFSSLIEIIILSLSLSLLSLSLLLYTLRNGARPAEDLDEVSRSKVE